VNNPDFSSPVANSPTVNLSKVEISPTKCTYPSCTPFVRVPAPIPIRQRQPHDHTDHKVKTQPKYNKGALLMGCNYVDTANQLSGCVNDVKATAKFLESQGYNTKTLLDAACTKYNMMTAMQQLCIQAMREQWTRVIITFSGHGGQQVQTVPNSEKDGLDEAIVPYDFEQNGFIIDNELYDIVINFPCPVVVWMDCCHSGSIVDLRFTYLADQFLATNSDAINEQTPNVICISGCKDQQTSADIASTPVKEAHGALTSAVLEVLTKYKDTAITWHALLLELQMKMVMRQLEQHVVLSSSKPLLPTSQVVL